MVVYAWGDNKAHHVGEGMGKIAGKMTYLFSDNRQDACVYLRARASQRTFPPVQGTVKQASIAYEEAMQCRGRGGRQAAWNKR